MLVGSSIVTTMLIPAGRVPARRRSLRPRARLPRARAPRARLRHALRHQHRRDPLVRRRVGDGRPAEPGAEVSAALRHGAGMGAREPAAGVHLHRHHASWSRSLRRRRRRAGRRLRDRRAGADGIGGARGDARRAAPRQAAGWATWCSRSSSATPRVDQHRRAARRPEDRELVHRRRSSSRRWCRACCDRPNCACRRSSRTTRGAGVPARERPAARSASSPTGPDSGLPEEYEHKLREASDSHHLTPGEQVLFLEVRPGDARSSAAACRSWRQSRRPPRAAVRQPGDPERDCRAPALHPRRDRPDPARRTSAGRKAIRLSTC